MPSLNRNSELQGGGPWRLTIERVKESFYGTLSHYPFIEAK
jgi:hypothetical protein